VAGFARHATKPSPKQEASYELPPRGAEGAARLDSVAESRETFGETRRRRRLVVGVHDRGDDELIRVLVLDFLEARHEL
jgi:hypothetical protein